MQTTIFTMLHLIVIMFCGTVTATAGFKLFGPAGGTVGGIVGAICGHIFGSLTSTAMNRMTVRYYRRMSTSALMAHLERYETAASYISCLVISILLERGEPRESLRGYIFRQLNSGDVFQRRAGLRNLGQCYPHLATRLQAFNTFAPSNCDLELLRQIEVAAEGTGP